MNKLALTMTAAAALWAANPGGAQEAATDAPAQAATEGQVCLDDDGDGIVNRLDPDAKGRGAHGFADADGDGINDLAQDADGDGIANGQDADYVHPAGVRHGRGFVDADGDGVNDLAQDADGDGIPNARDADYAMPEGARGKGWHHGNRGTAATATSGSRVNGQTAAQKR